ncbi:MAG: HlyD family efflux transporter periplasmic adaptor subunit [Bacteroidaceae bacterium]|nr:HlyD family efflux transporter periplasmic adaptor subunit [Bacteroidaceae bacterium]
MKTNHIFLVVPALLFTVSCNDNGAGTASGFFEAEEVTVSSEADGRLLKFNISQGDVINVGQSVGAVDSTALFLNRLQLIKSGQSVQSNRPDVELQIKALEAQLAYQESEQQRIRRLVEASAVPAKQLDDIKASINMLKHQINAQKSVLEGSVGSIDAQSSAIDIQIALLDDRISKCRLTAPVGGTVLTTYVHQGEFTSTGRPLYKVANLDEMSLRAYITSDQLAGIRLGQAVAVKAVFGHEQRDYTGKVTWISSKSEFTPKNIPTDSERADMVYAIKIAVQNDGFIKIGTFGQVKF